ncbi:hypothetical protein Fcan01_06773 [Folsomia candida]|uniref:Uncharacterized protein n=1 Tax=Folsomia candida TaxID=158441 RepID=A0A226EJ76_FOLCA|nr:hypothetical protein Fcan01_06773 [Folsomia candida]
MACKRRQEPDTGQKRSSETGFKPSVVWGSGREDVGGGHFLGPVLFFCLFLFFLGPGCGRGEDDDGGGSGDDDGGSGDDDGGSGDDDGGSGDDDGGSGDDDGGSGDDDGGSGDDDGGSGDDDGGSGDDDGGSGDDDGGSGDDDSGSGGDDDDGGRGGSSVKFTYFHISSDLKSGIVGCGSDCCINWLLGLLCCVPTVVHACCFVGEEDIGPPKQPVTNVVIVQQPGQPQFHVQPQQGGQFQQQCPQAQSPPQYVMPQTHQQYGFKY